MNREFINKHLCVMFEQTRMMREILGRLEMYMEEIEYELEEDPIGRPLQVTDLPYDARPKYCTCDDCWGVKSDSYEHRMD